MTKTYVIADLHGRFDLLDEAMRQIILRETLTPCTIIMLGDYIDRGPDSAKIIDGLMTKKPPKLHKLICLTGNHEQIMVETIRKPLRPDWWLANGGRATLASYGLKMKPSRYGGDYDPRVVPKDHVDWLASLPLYHMDKHRIYVHAGVEPQTPMDQQNRELLTWRIYPKNADGGLWLKGRPVLHVVHGHEQFPDGPKLYEHRTNLDVMAYDTGRLVIGVFDDDIPGGPVDLIEVTAS